MEAPDPPSPTRYGSSGKQNGAASATSVRPPAAVLPSSSALCGGGFPGAYPHHHHHHRTVESRSQSMLSDYSLEDEVNSNPGQHPGAGAGAGAGAGGGGLHGRRGAGGMGRGPDGAAVVSLAEAGLPGAPGGERRPRQYSVGSAGSW